jgi:ribosomal RNA assembly protein
MIDIIRITEERKAVLIGKNGAAKRKIEKEAGINIAIIDNDVEIEGDDLNVLAARDIIKAVGRGFTPKAALKLKDDEYQLVILNIRDYTTRNPEVVLARVIGTEGKTKHIIEEYTRTKISIYGKTVSIIGMMHDVVPATEAIEMLLTGAMHKTIYKYLERVKDKMKAEFEPETKDVILKTGTEKDVYNATKNRKKAHAQNRENQKARRDASPKKREPLSGEDD